MKSFCSTLLSCKNALLAVASFFLRVICCGVPQSYVEFRLVDIDICSSQLVPVTELILCWIQDISYKSEILKRQNRMEKVHR